MDYTGTHVTSRAAPDPYPDPDPAGPRVGFSWIEVSDVKYFPFMTEYICRTTVNFLRTRNYSKSHDAELNIIMILTLINKLTVLKC